MFLAMAELCCMGIAVRPQVLTLAKAPFLITLIRRSGSFQFISVNMTLAQKDSGYLKKKIITITNNGANIRLLLNFIPEQLPIAAAYAT